jgi:hypothetical protein
MAGLRRFMVNNAKLAWATASKHTRVVDLLTEQGGLERYGLNPSAHFTLDNPHPGKGDSALGIAIRGSELSRASGGAPASALRHVQSLLLRLESSPAAGGCCLSGAVAKPDPWAAPWSSTWQPTPTLWRGDDSDDSGDANSDPGSDSGSDSGSNSDIDIDKGGGYTLVCSTTDCNFLRGSMPHSQVCQRLRSKAKYARARAALAAGDPKAAALHAAAAAARSRKGRALKRVRELAAAAKLAEYQRKEKKKECKNKKKPKARPRPPGQGGGGKEKKKKKKGTKKGEEKKKARVFSLSRRGSAT